MFEKVQRKTNYVNVAQRKISKSWRSKKGFTLGGKFPYLLWKTLGRNYRKRF